MIFSFVLFNPIESYSYTSKSKNDKTSINKTSKSTSNPAGTKIARNNSSAKPKTEIDRSNKDSLSKVLKIWTKGDLVNVQLNLPEYSGDLTLSAYNIIGKEVLKIYQGPLKSDSEIYKFSIDDLPNGVYICVAQGRNFRNAEKFIVSKSR